MALQTSGAISIDDIHEEAGGTALTECSINDSDIRDLNEGVGKTINNASNSTISFDDFYGASASGGGNNDDDDTGLSEDDGNGPGEELQ